MFFILYLFFKHIYYFINIIINYYNFLIFIFDFGACFINVLKSIIIKNFKSNIYNFFLICHLRSYCLLY